MNMKRYLIALGTILLFACSQSSNISGTTEMENTMAQGDSSSSELVSSSDEASSSSEKVLSSSSSVMSSSGESSSSSGINIPPPMGCKPPVITHTATFGVVDAFIQKRVAALELLGVDNEAAKDSATEELYRELGLDSLFRDRPHITDDQLEYTLYYLYKRSEYANELSPEIVEDFADGTLEPENFCVLDTTFNALDNMPFQYLDLGCVYGSEVVNSLAILRNVWRKCHDMPYCDENVGDTIITVGKEHLVCESSSWITLEMQGKEKNGEICTENGARIPGNICFDGYWYRNSDAAFVSAEYFFNPDFEYGTFTDPRDGHVYKTTVYKEQTWLAQDIDYYDASDTLYVKQSKCAKVVGYGKFDEEKNAYCDGASRFYTFNVAKNVCPEGWRLPTKKDWDHIAEMGYNSAVTYFPKLYVDGTDEFGLSLRQNGGLETNGNYWDYPSYNLFWLENGAYTVNGDLFAYYSDDFSYFEEVEARDNGHYIAVRCIKK